MATFKDSSGPSIEALSAQVSEHAAAISASLRHHNLQQPTFSSDGEITFPPKNAPPELNMSRMALVQACSDLSDLVLGPVDTLMHSIIAIKVDVAVLRTLNSFNIPEAVPVGESSSYGDLAAKTRLNEDILARIVRYAATKRIFKIVKVEVDGKYEEQVAHTPMSRALVEHERLRGVLRHNFDDCFLGFYQFPEWLRDIGSSEEPTQSPFSYALKTEKSWFDWMIEPSRVLAQKSYHQTLSFLQEGPFHPKHAASASVLKALEPGSLVVDIGGSTGHVSIALAKELPHPRFVVQDLPATIEHISADTVPTELQDRVSFSAHDFFDTQPISANIYLLRFVLHDWSDKYCKNILRSILPQLERNPEARIVLLEAVLPEPGLLPPSLERGARSADLQMLGYASARERDEAMWESLVKATDDRLEVKGVCFLVGCAYSVIEIGLK